MIPFLFIFSLFIIISGTLVINHIRREVEPPKRQRQELSDVYVDRYGNLEYNNYMDCR